MIGHFNNEERSVERSLCLYKKESPDPAMGPGLKND